MLRNIFKKSLLKCVLPVVGAGIATAIFASSLFSATLSLKEFSASSTNVAAGQNMIVVDVFSSGTNTTHTQNVNIAGWNDVYVAFHCPANGVTVGTATFGLEETFDETTYGSVTASEMIRTTNTMLEQFNWLTGSGSNFINNGDKRGTNTSTFVGTLGTGTSRTDQFYHIMPYANILRFQCTLTSTGTDTVKYKILLRNGGTVNRF